MNGTFSAAPQERAGAGQDRPWVPSLTGTPPSAGSYPLFSAASARSSLRSETLSDQPPSGWISICCMLL